MQIGGISSISPIGSITPVQRGSVTNAPATGAAQPKSTTVESAATAPLPATSSSGQSSQAAPPARAAAQSHGGGGSASVSAAAETNTLAAIYSTTVGGKSYTGSVSEANGEYTASVPNLPGAAASGSSIEAAENNLSLVIDSLV